MENAKMKKSAAVIDRILKIVQGFAIAMGIVCLIFIPLTAILGTKIIADASHLELGVLELRLAGNPDAYLNVEGIKRGIIAMLTAGILIAGVVWYCLRVLRALLLPMKDGRPFEAGASHKLRKLAWSVLTGGVIAEIARVMGTVFELKAYDVEKLFDPSLISEISFNYSIHLWFVPTALILFFLSYIFRYGEELQREADETL